MPVLVTSSSDISSRALISVVLPAPLGPTIPILSPRIIMVLKLSTKTLPSYSRCRFLTLQTSLPLFSPSPMVILTLPTCSRRPLRSSRRAFSSRTRPSLRVRRALIPWRIQTSSCANFLSKLALFFSSASSCCSFNS